MIIFGRALSLAVGGALAAFLPAHAATEPAISGFAPGLEMISVHDIQIQLLARGYDPGAPSGVVNEATLRAILAFERDYGLPQDGIAGPVVQNMLHFLPRRPPPAELAALMPPAPALPAPNGPVAATVPPSAVPTPPSVSEAMAAAAAAAPPPAPPTSGSLTMPPPPGAMPAPSVAAAAAAPAGAVASQTASAGGPASAPEVQPAPPTPAAASSLALAMPMPPGSQSIVPDAAPVTASATAAPASPSVGLLAPILAPGPDDAARAGAAKPAMVVPPGKLGPLDPRPVAEPRIPVAQGSTDSSSPPAAPVTAAAAAKPQDAAPFTGDAQVREAQLYLRQLGLYHGEIDGVMDWPTVEALVKFDASGAGPKTVIADAAHPDTVWLARLKTAVAAKGE